ncbi:alpha/beta hydrolase [Actinoplanes sp. NPDC051494]|uniref:alpha/beta hydrolase n=1 Tax=Actinoplanes sp. NPDC051494 TaxID=3363907 RepID=UPI0037A25344
MDLRADLPRIIAPTLLIAGAQDPATPPSHSETIMEAVPGARLAVLSPAAHLATWEQGGRATELIMEALHG